MEQRLLVPFAGDGSGLEELTWGQWIAWGLMAEFGAMPMVGGAMRLEEGTTVENIVHLLSFIVSRHQSLRTRIQVQPDGTPRQLVADSGEIALVIVDTLEGEDPAEVAEAVRLRFKNTPFDIAEDWPVRMAVILKDSVPDHFVAVYSHIAIDGYGFEALAADLTNLDRTTGEHLAPVKGIQPMKLAQQQRTPAARQLSDVSLRYWERVLRASPVQPFNGPYVEREPRWWECTYVTPAAYLASNAISARTKLHTGPVLLAAYAVAVARVTGVNPSLIRIVVSNRFRPGFTDSVSVLGQPSLCLIDASDCTFDEAVVRAWHSQLNAAKNGYYDPRDMWALRDRIEKERGVEIDFGWYFNDGRRRTAQPVAETAPAEEQMWDALPLSRMAWAVKTNMPDFKVYFDINREPDSLSYNLLVDTRIVSLHEQMAIVRAVEEVLMAAAFDPNYMTKV
jgi:hypothetical protein